MNQALSFAKINILSENLVEVTINQDVEVSLEMSEEYNNFLTDNFPNDFALLVNKINQYDYAFEAKLSMASHENLKAIAVITYDNDSKAAVKDMADLRKLDGWNLKIFNGLNLGRQAAIEWLDNELAAI